MTQENQIVYQPNSSSLPIVQAEPIRDGRYYQALTVSSSEEEDGLRQLVGFVRRRIWVILGISLLSMTGLGAWILTRPAVYQGSFRLLVEPLSNQQDQISRTLELAAPEAGNSKGLDYKSQIEVLRSQKVLTPLFRDLQRLYPELAYEDFLTSLSIRNPLDTKLLDVSYTSRDQAQVQAILEKVSARFIQYSLIERNFNLQQGISFIDRQIAQQQKEVASLERQVEQLRRGNDIFRPDQSAEELSKQLTELLQRRRELASESAAARTLLAKLQEQLGLNPAEAVVVSTLSEAPTYQNLLNRLRELDAQIAIASSRFQDDSPMMQDLLAQREKLLPLISEEGNRIIRRSDLASRGANPQTLGFQGTLGRTMGQQLVDAANKVQTLRSQELALANAELQLRQQTRNFAGIARSYDTVQRNLKISTESLTRLLVARENLQLELTRQTMPWQLISTIDQKSIKDASGRLRQFLIAGVASLLLGLAVAWIMEKLDPSFRDIDDLSSELRLTCLGIIPYDPRKKRVKDLQLPASVKQQSNLPTTVTKEDDIYYSTSPFTEAFYSLYTNIRLMGSDNPIQVLTVVSTSPGDGKTTVSSNLAIAAAALGQRVLLIDVDMRYPRLHEAFQIANTRGLSNLLASDSAKTAQLSDLCHAYEEDENLQILTAGPQPPDPARLLSSNRIRNLLLEMREQFDLIIFDTPPLGHFVDAKLLASISDGTLLVVSVNKTDRTKAKQVVQDLTKSVSTPLLGCVVNGVKQSTGKADYYYNQAKQNQLASSST
jgi:polysaccharide biosynthesis transport protein